MRRETLRISTSSLRGPQGTTHHYRHETVAKMETRWLVRQQSKPCLPGFSDMSRNRHDPKSANLEGRTSESFHQCLTPLVA